MEGTTCKNHPDRSAIWQCTSCQGIFCEECINIQKLTTSATMESCKVCGGRCKSFGAKAVEEKKSEERPSFFSMLPSAFAYPVKGSGKLLIILGVIFFGIMKFLAAFAGCLGLIIIAFIAGYMIAFYYKIINASAIGNDTMPDWPEFSDIWSDILQPFFMFLLTFIVSFGPAGACFFFAVKFPLLVIPGIGLFVVGAFYLPMALISTALETNLMWNPVVIFSSIFRTIVPYLVACAVLSFVFFLSFMTRFLLNLINPVAGFLLGGFISFYFTIVLMRILGVLYYTNEQRLGWFEGFADE